MLVWFFRILSPILSIKYIHISPDISLKFERSTVLGSLRGITVPSIHFELAAHFSPVAFICHWCLRRHQIYTVAFSLAGLSLLVFVIHFFCWLPMHPTVLWFSCSSTSSFMSSLVLPSFHHTFDSILALIAALADISNLKTGFLSQELYLLHTFYLYLYIYTPIIVYTYVGVFNQKQIQKKTIWVFTNWNSANADSCYKRWFLVLFSQQRCTQIV